MFTLLKVLTIDSQIISFFCLFFFFVCFFVTFLLFSRRTVTIDCGTEENKTLEILNI